MYRFHSFIQHVLSNAAVLSSEGTAVTNVPAPGIFWCESVREQMTDTNKKRVHS